MITLGDWATPGGTLQQQEGTFMHELGHSLGLTHGGTATLVSGQADKGDTTIIGIADTSQIELNSVVVGPGIPANTLVRGITPNSVQLNQAVTEDVLWLL